MIDDADELKMVRRRMSSDEISDETKIPIGWLAAICAAAFAVFMVITGAIIWGVRLEARADSYGERVAKTEMTQESYGKNLEDIKESLWEIKASLQLKKEQNGSVSQTRSEK